jgi:hypothetical protein
MIEQIGLAFGAGLARPLGQVFFFGGLEIKHVARFQILQGATIVPRQPLNDVQ